MTREFNQIAKQLWALQPDTVRFVAHLSEEDRHSIEQSLFSLYGATVHLTGTESEIRKALEKARR